MDVSRLRRKALRLRQYDYCQPGFYFITLCIHERACLLGDVIEGAMRLRDAGRYVVEIWHGLPQHYANVLLDAFVVMPNHVHGIIRLVEGAGQTGGGQMGAGFKPAPTTRIHGVPEVVRALKTFSARRINVLRGMSGAPVWQRDYYERVIRNESELFNARQYIANNPLQWTLDEEHPANIRRGKI